MITVSSGTREHDSSRSSDTAPEYNSAMVGNGEVVTMIGPTGFHNGYCPPEERVNRTIFWAGRRLSDARGAEIGIPRVPPEELIGPTIPLVRFGRLHRRLYLDGQASTDHDWEQSFDPEKGRFVSCLGHGLIRERTETLVCLTQNLLVFRTVLENTGQSRAQLRFVVEYLFGDADGKMARGTRLHIRRPHPDDLGFGNVEGTRSRAEDPDRRPPHLRESLSVQYEIEKHLGEVRIGRHPNGQIRQTDAGGELTFQVELAPGAAETLWVWAALSDRFRYFHFPEFEEMAGLVEEHERAWREFWEASVLELGDKELESIRRSCLYTMRCYSSPWTLPPGYLSTHWEGRTFHDEFYPFLGLISSGYTELAWKIPNYRLQTLPLALERGGGKGAYFGWEVTESGEESAPYGHWTDEQFRHGQFSEQAWRYYLHTADLEALRRFYPVMRGCAEWMIHDLLVRDRGGRLVVRRVSDVAEHVICACNSIFAACAAVRALENAAAAAELLEVDSEDRERWRALAVELRGNLPVSQDGRRYRYADDSDLAPETAHLGMVFPFSFGVEGERSRETFRAVWEEYQRTRDVKTSDQVFSYNWIWAIGRLAAVCFYLGKPEEGYQVLKAAGSSLGPFLAPNEHYRAKEGAFLPWFGTGAGAFVYALNAMFVQVYDQKGAVLLPAVPRAFGDSRFAGLAADRGVRVSGRLGGGRLEELVAACEKPIEWSFRIPRAAVRGREFEPAVRESEAGEGWIVGRCRLEAGQNSLIRSKREGA
jgi:hypothetical protein